eukprot:1364803-Amphidinium_carterae.1
MIRGLLSQGHVARTAASYPPFWQLFHGLHTLELSVPKDGECDQRHGNPSLTIRVVFRTSTMTQVVVRLASFCDSWDEGSSLGGVLRLLGQNLGLLEGVHDLAIKCVADCEPKDGILPEGMLAFLLRLPNLSRLDR